MQIVPNEQGHRARALDGKPIHFTAHCLGHVFLQHDPLAEKLLEKMLAT
jgi:hypothetical protein